MLESPQDYGVAGGIAVTLAGVLGYTVKKLIDAFVVSKSDHAPTTSHKKLTTQEHDVLMELVGLVRDLETKLDEVHASTQNLERDHAPLDEDGVKLWYMPRSWGRTLNEILNILSEVLSNQEDSIKYTSDITEVKRLVEKLNKKKGE